MTRGNRDTTKPPLARAFTLVEVLMVVVILAVLASLISGVTVYVMDKANREQTLVNQQVIMNAVDRYYDIMGEYPPDGINPDAAETDKLKVIGPPPTDPNDTGLILLKFLSASKLDPDLSTDATNTTFKNRLAGRMVKINKSSAAILLELPEDAMDVAGFKDAYGNYMRYEETGGLGGTPVIISPGPDSRFADVTGVAADDEDNIRSDNR